MSSLRAVLYSQYFSRLAGKHLQGHFLGNDLQPIDSFFSRTLGSSLKACRRRRSLHFSWMIWSTVKCVSSAADDSHSICDGESTLVAVISKRGAPAVIVRVQRTVLWTVLGSVRGRSDLDNLIVLSTPLWRSPLQKVEVIGYTFRLVSDISTWTAKWVYISRVIGQSVGVAPLHRKTYRTDWRREYAVHKLLFVHSLSP